MMWQVNIDDAKAVDTIIMDIDGVLTDGKVVYPGMGDEIKFFHVRDGHGLKLARRAGLKTGCLSGRGALANKRRAEELQFDFIVEKCTDKSAGFARLVKEYGLDPRKCLYIGDDVVDIPVMRQVAIAVTVGDAPAYMDDYCHYRTRCNGGQGAVREVIDLLLQAQGKWDQIMEKYLK